MTDHAIVERIADELRAAGRADDASALRRAAGLAHTPSGPLHGLATAADMAARALRIDLLAPVIYRRPSGAVAALEYRGLRCRDGIVVGAGLVGRPAQRLAIVADLDSVGAVVSDAAAALAAVPGPTAARAIADAVASLSDEARGLLGVAP